jgi:hypothetical protein
MVFYSVNTREPFFEQKRVEREADNLPHLISMLRISGSLPLLPTHLYGVHIHKCTSILHRGNIASYNLNAGIINAKKC